MLRGRYVEQLRQWEQWFPRSQLLVLQSERLFDDPASTSARVYDFLGLDRQQLRHYKTFLGGKYDRDLPPDLRAGLAAYFEPYNRRLYELVGADFGWESDV